MKALRKLVQLERQIVKSQAGFSLVEILVALTLIGLAGTFVVGKIFENLEDGRKQATTIQIGNFKKLLNDYRYKCGSFPGTEQGLDALISKPTGGTECKAYPPNGFLDGSEIPLDPWDEEYIYQSDGKKFNISSMGPDRIEGTEDDVSLNKKKKSSDSGDE
ncbi:type II secretion system major pseudopilin GspG [Bacteriovoracaceae bacterium]|nr:type II secretion system major pseudopilin GspG [Bacteriovoracaceae bacterium]|tara:strand:- start:178122 stop:178604 length:483 start_codon:yes stop_codon:yes gene_type:complete